MTETQILELHASGIDKIGILLVAEDHILSKITGMELDTIKNIKSELHDSGIILDYSNDQYVKADEETLEKPYAILYAITQAEIFDWLKVYHDKTGKDIVNVLDEQVEFPATLSSLLIGVEPQKDIMLLASFPFRSAMSFYEFMHDKKMDIRMIIEFRKYICSTTGMPMSVYDSLDEYSHKAGIWERIERESLNVK